MFHTLTSSLEFEVRCGLLEVVLREWRRICGAILKWYNIEDLCSVSPRVRIRRLVPLGTGPHMQRPFL